MFSRIIHKWQWCPWNDPTKPLPGDDRSNVGSIRWDQLDISERPHLAIHRRCCACEQPFNDADSMVAITRRGGQLQIYDAQTATRLKFPKQGTGVHASFCNKPNCSSCSETGPSATVHLDCFKLYVKECKADDKIQRLWLAATAMKPWGHCEETCLVYNADERMATSDAARAWDMPMADCLPGELSQIILGYTKQSLCTRFISVLSRARELAAAPSPREPPVQMRLVDVKRWSRGMPPLGQVSEESGDKYMRITIDSSGIQKIERVPDVGKPMHSTHLRKLFIVEEISKLRPVKAEFVSNFCHLTVPDDLRMILWDNPMPLKLYDELNLPATHKYTRFTAIDTSICTGLTFFFYQGQIVAIHPHVRNTFDDDALRTFEALPLIYQGAVVWHYVPLPKYEEINGICLRGRRTAWDAETVGPCLALFLRDKRVIDVGYRHAMADEFTVWSTHGRPLLLFNMCTRLEPPPDKNGSPRLVGVQVCNAYPSVPEQRVLNAEPPPPNIFRPREQPLYECASDISLDHVTSADVFDDPASGLCRGILFNYKSGQVQAHGECRIGIDNHRHYDNPVWFFFTKKKVRSESLSIKITGVEVEFTDKTKHFITPTCKQLQWGTPWLQYQLKGKILQCRFTHKSSVLRVDDA